MQHCHYYFHDFIILYHTASFHLNIYVPHHIKTAISQIARARGVTGKLKDGAESSAAARAITRALGA